MAERYRSPSNWGCVLAFAVGFPMLLVALLFAVLDSGRCETKGPDCHIGGPPYGMIWLGIVAGSFCLAWALNARMKRRRYDRDGKDDAAWPPTGPPP